MPRVKITFRGVRPDLYCINPECPEHHRAFRIGVCPSCGSPLQIRYSFRGNRFVGCTGYPTCRVTYPLPQRGKLEKDQPPCPVCRAPVVTAIEAGRPPWTLCINPECPTRQKKSEAKKARAGGARATKRAKSVRKRGSPPSVVSAPGRETPAPAGTPSEPTSAASRSPKPRRRPRRAATGPGESKSAATDSVSVPP